MLNRTIIKEGRIFHAHLDPVTGKRLPIPKGEKPPRMIQAEKERGLDFETDYNDNYLSGKMGQAAFARRWGVPKKTIFSRAALTNPKGRRSWHIILGLPLFGFVEEAPLEESEMLPRTSKLRTCAICGKNETEVVIESAHWIERGMGQHGPDDDWNRLNLCENHHGSLDQIHDPNVTALVEKKVFIKAMKAAVAELNASNDTPEKQEQLFKIGKQILMRKVL